MLKSFIIGGVIGLAILIPALVIVGNSHPAKMQLPNQSTPQINKIVSNPSVVATISAATQDKAKPDHTTPPPANLPPTGSSSPNGIPILMYHYIGLNPNPKTDHSRDILSTSPTIFTQQMQYLAANHYTPITLNTLYAVLNHQAPKPTKPIVLTFDDGYNDFFFNAYPILRSFGFHAVEFIPTGLMGKPAYMTWDQVKDINSSGLIDFEAHTVDHASLPSLPYDKMLWEIKTSKQVLQDQLGHPINFLAYPYGTSNAAVWKATQDSGFVAALGTWEGRANANGINMPRIRINGGISLGQFASLVAE